MCILEEKNLFFCKKLPHASKLLPVSGKNYSYSQFGLNSTLESSILKIVNVDVDPNHKSTRVEWASAMYRSYHHPLAAFELELYWKMATGQLLADLINNWAKMSNKYNYHIVPGPIDPFASPMDPYADPLRGCIFIKINLKLLLQDEKILFENYIEKKYFKYENDNLLLKLNELFDDKNEFMEYLKLKYQNDTLMQKLEDKHMLIEQDFQEFIERERILRLQYFQEAILERFGFIRNAAITKEDTTKKSEQDATFFIHSSGGMFVLIPNSYANYTGRSRHSSTTNQTMPKRSENESHNGENGKFLENFKSFENVKKSLSFIDSDINNDNSSTTTTTNKQLNLKSRSQFQFYEINKYTISNTTYNEQFSVTSQLNSSSVGSPSTQYQLENEISTTTRSLIDSIDALNKFKLSYSDDTLVNQQNSKNDGVLPIIEQNIIIDDRYTIKKRQPFYLDNEFLIGFLWSWNFMLGKRWRTQYTGEKFFQDCILADFISFCSNKEDRLTKFYNESKNEN